MILGPLVAETHNDIGYTAEKNNCKNRKKK